MCPLVGLRQAVRGHQGQPYILLHTIQGSSSRSQSSVRITCVLLAPNLGSLLAFKFTVLTDTVRGNVRQRKIQEEFTRPGMCAFCPNLFPFSPWATGIRLLAVVACSCVPASRRGIGWFVGKQPTTAEIESRLCTQYQCP